MTEGIHDAMCEIPSAQRPFLGPVFCYCIQRRPDSLTFQTDDNDHLWIDINRQLEKLKEEDDEQ